MQEKERKELIKNLNDIKQEVAGLRNSLNEINEQKEHFFDLKEKHSKDIVELINKVKQLKNLRNNLTKGVRQKKDKRNELQKEIKESIEKAKSLNDEKRETVKKYNEICKISSVWKNINTISAKIDEKKKNSENSQEPICLTLTSNLQITLKEKVR